VITLTTASSQAVLDQASKSSSGLKEPLDSILPEELLESDTLSLAPVNKLLFTLQTSNDAGQLLDCLDETRAYILAGGRSFTPLIPSLSEILLSGVHSDILQDLGSRTLRLALSKVNHLTPEEGEVLSGILGDLVADSEQDILLRGDAAVFLRNNKLVRTRPVTRLFKIAVDKAQTTAERISTLYLLQDLGSPTARRALEQLARRCRDEEVISTTAGELAEVLTHEALREIRGMVELDSPGTVFIEPVFKLLTDTSGNAGIAADATYTLRTIIQSLPPLSEQEALVPQAILSKIIADSKVDLDLRSDSAHWLGSNDLLTKRLLTDLSGSIKSSTLAPGERLDRIYLLQKTGSPAAADALVQIMEACWEEEDIRVAAISAIGEIIQDTEAGVRASVIRTFQQSFGRAA
jgi:hypothetical protein